MLLYGDSGNGKSSLVNAGLLPRRSRWASSRARARAAARRRGARLERIATADDGAERCRAARREARLRASVLSIDAFEAAVATPREHRPLIVFDQFEEILTLFDDAIELRRARREVIRLLRDACP